MVSLTSDDTAAAKAAAAAAAAVAKLEAERTRYDNMVNPTITMNRKARLRPELKEKISVWILSFYHLDPRYKILTFFNLVASEGADNVTDDQLEENHSYAMMRSTETNNSNNNNNNRNNNSSKSKSNGISTSSSSSSKNNNHSSNNKSNGSSSSSKRSTPPPLPRKASAKRNSGGGRRTASSSATAISSSAKSTTSTSTTGSVNSRQAYQVNAHLMSRPSARNIRPSTLSLLSRIFNATSILTVWRPCSNDAMRKMMEGTGVGKGLDIKGKSAKKGKLSAFVPFMQIFHNEQKHEIQPISVGAEMRIYYKDEKLRDHVLQKLQDFLEHGPPDNNNNNNGNNNNGNGNNIELNADEDADVVEEEEYNNSNNNDVDVDDEAGECESQATEGATNTTTTTTTTKGKKTKSLSSLSCNSTGSTKSNSSKIPDHKNPNSSRYVPTKLKKLKKYAKTGYWGIECSQRLFWYATIEDADISRTGTGTETGRPSLSGFQDANMKTLKIAHQEVPKPTPMPVILQYKSLEDCSSNNDDGESQHLDSLDACLDPRFLVMAYEEQGTIKPVVSDFDGFLLGWRREALWFGCNLPRYQEELMVWCVDRIEEILEDQKKNPTNSDTWTQRWLEVKKKAAEEGFHIEVPEYGFGDPKSTSIMEHAALKLKSTGAVRHGSECFNYGFPQEIDDLFLVISDTLKPVPWKYVNIDELQAILTQRIAEGFVFPINPKWILCDPGWKKIFDDLMASEALYADLSKDVWYPPHTGIREKIDDIYRRHPNGFQRCTDKSIVGCSKGKKDKIHPHGRRQSATNILRDTLDDGIGSELTGNAFADLAELELDDFLDRTSAIVPNKMGGSGRGGTEIGRDMMKACRELDDENSLGKSTHHAHTDSSSSLKKIVTFPGGTSHSFSSRRAFGGDEKRGSFVSHTSSISSVNSNRDSTNPDARRDTSSAARVGRKLLGSSLTSSSSSKSRRNIRGSKSQRNFFRRKHVHDDGRGCDDDCASEASDAEMRRPTSAPDLAKEGQQSNTKSRTHRFTNPFLKFSKKR